jgi:alkylation response protein AidB-like acyl-CoA dehydrogenase
LPDVVAVARALADGVLFPDAAAIERADALPVRYLDELAGAGLYGLFGPAELGGWDADPTSAGRVIEALAGASLTTTLVWIQHHSVVRALRAARPKLRDQWLARLVSGKVRAGIAYAALRRPGPPAMAATRDNDGWRFDGYAPWVTGWGRIDLLYVGGVSGDDVIWALVPPAPAPGLTVEPLRLGAVAASSTVAMRLSGYRVDADGVVDVEPRDDWRVRDRRGLRTNGFLPIGVAARCARLLVSASLTRQVDAARRRLDETGDDDVVAARADASLLAVQAASALVARGGGRSSDWDSHAQRLARDATFLLVFGQTAAIRAAQLSALRVD